LKAHIHSLFEQALAALQADGVVATELEVAVKIERTRDSKFGDFACNLAMLLAKAAKQNPRALAAEIIARLPASVQVAKTEIAGPGFINVFVTPEAYLDVVNTVLEQTENYGQSAPKNQKILLEYVSANPTGPLHVGHGRGAAYGSSLANLLKAGGYDVHCEYYVNDAGRQMDILAASVWLRYLELCGEELVFPSNGYKGDYIWDIAATLHRENGDAYRHPVAMVFAEIPADAPAGGDKEAHIDALIERARVLLGETAYRQVHALGVNTILEDIRRDLAEFRVEYDEWFSERSLTDKGMVAHALDALQSQGHSYEKDGALWFRSTDFGDEKDRVLVRDNGQSTYFASDVAYHLNKLERGYDLLINIWGADHHGYMARVRAAIAALGGKPDALEILLVQFAILFQGDARQQMSTRSGEFVTLRELRQEVGEDATRFFYVLRRSEQHMEFDLALAKSESSDNPVYYVQYAHARIASVMRELVKQGGQWQHAPGTLGLLNTAHEQSLLNTLVRYPEVIESAASAREPHQIAYYLRDLANALHTYYNAHKVLIEEDALRNARLSLLNAVQQVLRNGLAILGVSAPERM
jgi:arginyl-tRNA synthetase